MKTENIYKAEAFKVHRELVRSGMFKEAGRLLRALNNGVQRIQISYSDTDWSLAAFYGLPGAYSIRIR